MWNFIKNIFELILKYFAVRFICFLLYFVNKKFSDITLVLYYIKKEKKKKEVEEIGFKNRLKKFQLNFFFSNFFFYYNFFFLSHHCKNHPNYEWLKRTNERIQNGVVYFHLIFIPRIKNGKRGIKIFQYTL